MFQVSIPVHRLLSVTFCPQIQWNLNIAKGQGTGIICLLYRGFVISRFFFIYFTITGVKKIVSYTEDFVKWRFFISRFHSNTLIIFKPFSVE